MSDRDGAFHCSTCLPRPRRPCGDCGRQQKVRANWPIGPVCDACYLRRKRNPAPCSRCHLDQVLVGQADDGNDLCGPCCGTDIAFACRRCGFPGDIFADGACTRCVASERVRDLLSAEDGTIDPALRPLADGLAAVDNPVTVVSWLRHSAGSKILAGLVSQRAEITHASLDVLPQDKTTRYVREVLVATGILPQRQEYLAQLEIWTDVAVQGLPPHQARIIRPFAEWGIIRDARRRAARGRYRTGAAATDRYEIRTAIKFLTWLDEHQRDLATLAQEDLDLWLVTHPTKHRPVSSFIRWAVARRLTGELTIPARRSGSPYRFLGDQEHHDQLKRCLNDGELPIEARIAGALTGLYALPTVRIVELTTDRFHHDGDASYITIDRNPVLLPPKLARLIDEQAARPTTAHMARPKQDDGGFLFPGQFASRPISAGRLQTLMKQHGLAVISARNTAMIEAVADLPPIVISDLFGIHPTTAYAWAQYAQDSWADYLAAGHEDTE
ncbi:hypothetical protein ACFU7Y_16610 [Kitasatospora sp. NPDC057542]|uniref:hypothetical protein n=1 Tax=Kitasatospora sp. NPDC057542 TaxID=3346162 RepID=UPI0036B9D864